MTADRNRLARDVHDAASVEPKPSGDGKSGGLQTWSLEGGVLITIHRLSQGGADRVAMLLANGFVAADIPTAILIFRSGGEAEELLLSMLDRKVTVIFAGVPMGSRHLELVRGFFRTRREIEFGRPAVVFASSSNMGLVTGMVARSQPQGRPAFLMKLTNPVIRPRDAGPLRQFYRRCLYHLVFGGFDKTLVLSTAEQGWLSRTYSQYENRFETVANPYITRTMLTQERAPLRDRICILTAARLMPQKRLDRLIAAIGLIEDPGITLTILGEGPERPALERQIAALGLQNRVHLMGFVSDIVPWLKKATLFALSSDYEGLPAAILEALACGIPVVTTNCFAGARDLLAPADGCMVVEREDIEGLAAALATGIKQTKSSTCRARAEPYEMDVAIDAHVEVIRNLKRTGQASGR